MNKGKTENTHKRDSNKSASFFLVATFLHSDDGKTPVFVRELS